MHEPIEFDGKDLVGVICATKNFAELLYFLGARSLFWVELLGD